MNLSAKLAAGLWGLRAASIHDTHSIELCTACHIKAMSSILSLYGLMQEDQVLFMTLELDAAQLQRKMVLL